MSKHTTDRPTDPFTVELPDGTLTTVSVADAHALASKILRYAALAGSPEYPVSDPLPQVYWGQAETDAGEIYEQISICEGWPGKDDRAPILNLRTDVAAAFATAIIRTWMQATGQSAPAEIQDFMAGMSIAVKASEGVKAALVAEGAEVIERVTAAAEQVYVSGFENGVAAGRGAK